MINYKINDNNKYLSVEGGTLSGDLNMGGRLIKNVADPINDSDSITKKYVKDNFATQEDFSAIGILLSLNNIVLLKVVNCNGVPAYGVTASGVKDANGNDIVIGQDGLVNGICTGTIVTFKATEMADYTYDVSSIKGSSQRTIITLPSIENRIIRYDTTTAIKLSAITGKVDVCCVGGGGGGGSVIVDSFRYSDSDGYVYGGGGGGGGNIVNKYNIAVSPQMSYILIIGAGGKGSSASNLRRSDSSTVTLAGGSNGGNTSAFGVTATGGGGATKTVAGYKGNSSNANGGSSTNGGKGGDGNFNTTSGGNLYNLSASTKGENAIGTEFDDGKTYYSGGGGASCKVGGSPYGGNGTYSYSSPDSTPRNGTGYGGGGNGSPNSYTSSSSAGSGYKGLVAIRFHDATL